MVHGNGCNSAPAQGIAQPAVLAGDQARATSDAEEPPCSGYSPHPPLHSHQQHHLQPHHVASEKAQLDEPRVAVVDIQLDSDRHSTSSTRSSRSSTVAATVDLHQPHSLEPNEVIAQFQSNTTTGLAADQAAARLAEHGPNQLKETNRVSATSILIRQMANALTLVLLAAMALSFGVKDWVEGGVVTAVIVTNVLIGFIQEYKAERTMASLRTLSSPSANVLRDSTIRQLPSTELVPGDIVHFRAGDLVPADVRLVTISNLEIDEAPLTGESVPAIKTTGALTRPHLGPADRTNLAYAGTTVTKGRAVGIVVATGMHTQIGQIATALAKKGNKDDEERPGTSEPGTPPPPSSASERARHCRSSSTNLPMCSSSSPSSAPSSCLVSPSSTSTTRSSSTPSPWVSVSSPSRSLPCSPSPSVWVPSVWPRATSSFVVSTPSRRLVASPTSAVTRPAPSPRVRWSSARVGRSPRVSNKASTSSSRGATAFEPKGRVLLLASEKDAEPTAVEHDQIPDAVRQLATAASLCNIAEIEQAEDGTWTARGDPTEIALQYKDENARTRAASQDDESDESGTITTTEKKLTSNTEIVNGLSRAAAEQDFRFIGLLGIYDPPRAETRAAVEACKRAGIVVHMLTGDHPATAHAIAREVAIVDGTEGAAAVMTAAQFDGLTGAEIDALPDLPLVVARCSPATKVRMIAAGKRRGRYPRHDG
ncbi:hypothetical protein L1887_60179 [Cichorium endivia]|nr:hypothetical protein L1887_60179 [Cichorium endivia]